MNKPAPTFRSIASPLDDVSDDALDRLVDQLAVPKLIKPEPPPAPVAETSIQEAASAAAQGGQTNVSDRSSSLSSTLPEPEVVPTPMAKVSVSLPEYLHRAMRMRVGEEGTTMRYLVMQALQTIGFKIDPRDFVRDGRDPRPKSS